MTLPDDRLPVIVAAGQSESRDLELGPLELGEQACREAISSLGAAGRSLAAAVERLSVVNILSRRGGPAPASELSGRLGLSCRRVETTTVGGDTPQSLVARAARDIAAGRLEATLIAGAEAVRSGRLRSSSPGGPRTARENPEPPPAPAPHRESDPVVGTFRQDLSEAEHAAGLLVPVQVYPLIESALAARAGRDPGSQRAFLGELLAPFSAVASTQPHAWFREARTPVEIATPSPVNRLVAEPYTKWMTSFLGGAQGAALLMTSFGTARRLSIGDRAVFVWASAATNDVWYPLQRPDLAQSPAIRAAGRAVLEAGRVSTDDLDLIDIYSCFPSAVQLGARALGLKLDDPRRLTCTGGLAYFGGPGNNYTTHALAVAWQQLLETGPGSLGLVTSLGWYATKHAVGLYGTAPPPSGFVEADTASEQAEIDATALPLARVGDELDSTVGTVIGSSAFYDREQRTYAAPVYATLDDGTRVAAAARSLDDVAPVVAARFLVGARVHVDNGVTPPVYEVIDR